MASQINNYIGKHMNDFISYCAKGKKSDFYPIDLPESLIVHAIKVYERRYSDRDIPLEHEALSRYSVRQIAFNEKAYGLWQEK